MFYYVADPTINNEVAGFKCFCVFLQSYIHMYVGEWILLALIQDSWNCFLKLSDLIGMKQL